MEPLVKINRDKCVNCYACVRVCPVKAIEVNDKEHYTSILPDRCVGCGSCLNICPVNAISYRSSIDEVKELLNAEGKVAAIVDPSISGEFSDITDYRKFVQMIKALGFSYVCEVTFGVDMVAQEYKKLFDDFKGKHFISSVCPVIVDMVQKYHSELVNNLAPIVTPMISTAKVVRKEYGKDTKVVFIGPCVKAKDEAFAFNDDGRVDSVLTFTELRKLFDEFNIKESKVEYDEFDAPIGYKGSLMPISNGILQAVGINEDLLSGEVITAEGKESVKDAFKGFANNAESISRHFNLFFCQGCLLGPGTTKGGHQFIRRTMVVNYANKRLKTFDHKTWEKNMEKHNVHSMVREFQANDKRISPPPQERVKEILKVIGKDPRDANTGCEACGYSNCQEFAAAVDAGLAHPDMCLNFSMSNRFEYIEALQSVNEKLERTENALKEAKESARAEQEVASDATETMTTLLKKLPSSLVIVDKDLKILQSNEAFINLMGDDAREINEIIPALVGADLRSFLPYNIYNLFTSVLQNNSDIKNKDIVFNDNLLNLSIFTIKEGRIAGAVIRDLYAPEVQKEEVIKRITEAVDINLAMVQKIGFLLGEGAAETEHMLNSIIKTYKKED